MGFSNSQTHYSFILILLFLNKAESAEIISFSFSKFTPGQKNLILQGDAVVRPNGKLELTKLVNGNPVKNSVGRALYSAPIRIYDSNTDNVASFTTSFSFVVKAPATLDFADGLAFFLAPIDTQPQNLGGLLGLFPGDGNFSTTDQIVAVEIDTFINTWDPNSRHIGINVNSIRSDKTSFIELVNGQVANVVITYQATSKIISASLVYPSRETSYIVSSFVDLKDVLPEFVRVGFSATTGLNDGFVQSNDILSWSFESKFPNTCANDLEDFHVI